MTVPRLLSRALVLAGCAYLVSASARAAEAGIDTASVERLQDGTVVVRWTVQPLTAPIDVSIYRPGSKERRLISDDDVDGKHTLTKSEASARPLIYLTAANGMTFVVAERQLPLEGGRNFRDLGGYETEDGWRVKWGQIYRSGTMAFLTDNDYRLLSTLGIRVLCDFRANEEREREPTRWNTAGTAPAYRSRDYAADSSKLREIFSEGTPSAVRVREGMTDLYRDLPYEHADSYRAMFKSLAAGELPLSFNCSAGKDRTGVGAALLLTMLGVPKATVMDDYALSERLVDYEAQLIHSHATAPNEKPGPYDFLTKLPPQIRAPLLRSDPAYLEAALEAIEKREGSIDDYFENVLGLSAAERQRIREALLEPKD